MNIKEMTSIQKHCVSYLMNELNVAVIGASKGKSISYLGLIVSSMMSNINKIVSFNYKCMYLLVIILCSLI